MCLLSSSYSITAVEISKPKKLLGRYPPENLFKVCLGYLFKKVSKTPAKKGFQVIFLHSPPKVRVVFKTTCKFLQIYQLIFSIPMQYLFHKTTIPTIFEQCSTQVYGKWSMPMKHRYENKLKNSEKKKSAQLRGQTTRNANSLS